MTLARWLILLLNMCIIALISFLAFHFNFDTYYAENTMPGDFHSNVLKFKPKTDDKLDRAVSPADYVDITKALGFRPAPDPVVVVKGNTTEITVGADMAKLVALVKEIESVLYNPDDSSRSGAHLKTTKTSMFYLVNDAIIYGDETEKDAQFFLHGIEQDDDECYKVVFRDKNKNLLTLEFKCPMETGIIIK